MGTESRYDTHFLCALCGGPFAEVFRTAVDCHLQPQPPAENNTSDDGSQDAGNPDTDLSNEFNIPENENCVIPEEVVEDGMSYIARRERARRIQAQRARARNQMFVRSEPRVVQRAYNGHLISAKQMGWTRCLRALICTEAKHQPRGWQAYNEEDDGAYLTGRGMVRKWDRTADAYPSVESEEDEPGMSIPVFDGSARARDDFKFEMYQGQPQSISSTKTDGFISSIPFHDECWSMFETAISESRRELGLPKIQDSENDDDSDDYSLKPDHMWRYLRDLIAVSGVKQEVAISREQFITRLSEIDYREAQSSGEGWKWKHEDGYHWLVADPLMNSVLNDPLVLKPATTPHAIAPRPLQGDPFMLLPPEMLSMISGFLTAADIFSLKIACPTVCNFVLPDKFYKRFLRTEFGHIEMLSARLDQEVNIPVYQSKVDWRGTWEKLRTLVRTPRNPDNPDEWRHVDIGLKNRCRIWKIVKPIAEVLVHTSSEVLLNLHRPPQDVIDSTTLVRGFMGTRSGKEGRMENVYLRGAAYRKQIPSDDEFESAPKIVEYEQSSKLESIWIWLERRPDGVLIFCGLGFHIISHHTCKLRIFGRKGPELRSFGEECLNCQRVLPHDREHHARWELQGFGFCLADSIITGIKILYNGAPRGIVPSEARYGYWPNDGFVRHIIVPKDWRKLCGMVGFMNSFGYFETIGLLEQKLKHDSMGRLLPDAPMNVPLSHEEASLWKKAPPPLGLILLEREGPVIPDWRLRGAEFEIWDPHSPKLYEITGWADKKALRGLEFHYRDTRTGKGIARMLGTKNRGSPTRFKVGYDDTSPGQTEQKYNHQNIQAMVVGVSDEGIHSVHFVTDQRKVSGSLGPRYKGTHKVFAPLPKGANRSTARRDDLHQKIIGIHVLYDYEEERFLQLGIITKPTDALRELSKMTCSIPFDEASDVDGVWCDGKPPETWITGAKQTFSGGSNTHHSASIPAYRTEFSGWVGLKDVREVTIYGRMEGIMFRYHNGSGLAEQYFGNIEARPATPQCFNRDEKIIDLAVEEPVLSSGDLFTPENDMAHSIASASSVDRPNFLPKLMFRSQKTPPSPNYTPVIDRAVCKYLTGIRFDFNANMLIDWSPAFGPSPEDEEQDPELRSDLRNFARLSWDTDELFPDNACEIAPNSECYHVTFETSRSRPITAIKGYIDRMGKFAGLLLRRGSEWDTQVFGRPMGSEIEVFELGRGELIDGIYLTGRPAGRQTFTAIALTTTAGRSTPWIGNPGKEKVFYRMPPPSYTAAGIFGTFPQIPYQSAPNWDSLGLLWRITDETECNNLTTPPPTPNVPTHPQKPRPTLPYGQIEPTSQLRWFINPAPYLSRYALHMISQTPLVSNPELGCTFCTIDPPKLLQLQFYITALHGVAGIRFRGTPEMGIVTFNSWPDVEGTRMRRMDKMMIDGPAGERIIKIDVSYQDAHVVGIEVFTSFDRSKRFIAPSQFPRRRDEMEVREMAVGRGRRLKGFFGVAARYRIHDLGLMFEDIEEIEEGTGGGGQDRGGEGRGRGGTQVRAEMTAENWSWTVDS